MRKSFALPLVLVAVLSMLAPRVGDAEDSPPPPAPSCHGNESLVRCYNRLRDLFDRAAKAKEEKKETTQDEAVNSMVEAGSNRAVSEAEDMSTASAKKRAVTSATEGTSQAVTDLLPSFFGALGISGLNQTDEGFSFDKTFPLLNKSLRLDLGATSFRDADVFEPLKKALPEDGSETLLSDLQEKIGDFDKTDFRLAMTWHKDTGEHRFGRDPASYQDLTGELFSSAHVELVKARRTPLDQWVHSQEVLGAEERWGKDRNPALLEAPLEDVRKELPETAAVLEAGAIRAATGMETTRRQLGTEMSALAKEVGQLITNQPQLVLEGAYNERANWTGPDGWSAMFRYEIGMSGNFNDFLSWANAQDGKRPCEKQGTGYSYACYQEYKRSSSAMGLSESKAIDHGFRLAIEAKYTDTDPLHFEDPESDFRFDLAGTQVWTASLTGGFYFTNFQLPNLVGAVKGTSNIVPTDNARFDLEVKYDDATGDAMRQDRFVATATVSQKMSDSSVLSISAVYADKPEYLGEVDHELSANLGLRWSFDGKGKDKGTGQAP